MKSNVIQRKILNDLLQLVGSLASIIGIPLAIFLYLKGQLLKYTEVRREIIKTLSYQIGEGRSVKLFELNSVIDALVREKRLKPNSISVTSIIEDLTTEIISSPLLESQRKEKVVKELSYLHPVGKILNSIKQDENIYANFIEFINQHNLEEPEQVEVLQEELKKTNNESNSKSLDMFGFIAGIMSIFVATLSFIDYSTSLKFIPKILNNEMLTSMIAGISISIISAIIVSVFKQNNKNKNK